MANFQRIGVLRANALGDLIFTLPALSALRHAHPEAEIVLLGKESHRQWLSGRPSPVDRVDVLPPIPGVTAPQSAGPVTADTKARIERLRAQRFDLVVQLHGGGRYSNPFVRELGAPMTVGLQAPDAEPLDLNLPYVYYQSEVSRYLEVVGLLGIPPVELEPVFAVTSADREELRPYDLPAPLVAIHSGASDPRRRWASERFAAVADAVAEAGGHVVLTGSDLDAEPVRQFRQAVRAPVLDSSGQLSVGGLAALYERCSVVVSNDTGPLHLAAAAGAPVVGIFWVGNLINAALQTRRTYRPQISWTIHCPVCGADCTRDLYPARTGGTPCDHDVSFVDDVSTPEVISATLELLAENSKEASPS